jgi:hypothetical protein
VLVCTYLLCVVDSVVGTLAKSSTSQPDKPEPLEWDQTQNVHIFIGNFFICLVRFLLSLLLHEISWLN